MTSLLQIIVLLQMALSLLTATQNAPEALANAPAMLSLKKNAIDFSNQAIQMAFKYLDSAIATEALARPVVGSVATSTPSEPTPEFVWKEVAIQEITTNDRFYVRPEKDQNGTHSVMIFVSLGPRGRQDNITVDIDFHGTKYTKTDVYNHSEGSGNYLFFEGLIPNTAYTYEVKISEKISDYKGVYFYNKGIVKTLTN